MTLDAKGTIFFEIVIDGEVEDIGRYCPGIGIILQSGPRQGRMEWGNIMEMEPDKPLSIRRLTQGEYYERVATITFSPTTKYGMDSLFRVATGQIKSALDSGEITKQNIHVLDNLRKVCNEALEKYPIE